MVGLLACIGAGVVAYLCYIYIEPIHARSQLDQLKYDKLVAILYHEHDSFKEYFDQQLVELSLKQDKSIGTKRIEMFGKTIKYSKKEHLNSFRSAIQTKVNELDGKVTGDERYLFLSTTENQVDKVLFKYQMENLKSEIRSEMFDLKARTRKLQKQLLVHKYHDLLQELFSEERELSKDRIVYLLEVKLKVQKENLEVVWSQITDEETGIVSKTYNSTSYTYDMAFAKNIIAEREIYFRNRSYLLSKEDRA